MFMIHKEQYMCYYSRILAKHNYRVLVRVCVCIHVFFRVVFFRNMKFKYLVRYKNNSENFDIGHYRIKVKVTAGIQTVFPFTTVQTVRSYNSTLVQARKLIKHLCSSDINLQYI